MKKRSLSMYLSVSLALSVIVLSSIIFITYFFIKLPLIKNPDTISTNYNPLIAGIVILCSSVLTIFFLTGFFLRHYLKEPLRIISHFLQNFDNHPKNTANLAFLPSEFDTLLTVFKKLNSRIESQFSALTEAELKYRTIFENTLQGLFRLSDKGVLLSSNASFAKILACSSRELLSLQKEIIPKYIVPDKREREYLNKILEVNGFVENFETHSIRYNQESFWSLLSIRRVDQSDDHFYFECALVDNSDRKEREIAQHKSEEANTTAKAKSEFIAQLSHEIRTPMNAVLGYLHLLEKSKLSSDQIEFITHIKDSTSMLLDIINNVLDYSKLEASKLILERIPFSIEEAINQTVSVLQISAKEKGLLIRTQFDHKLPSLHLGDPVRFRQILLNLGSNAIKFTDQGEVFFDVSYEKGKNHSLVITKIQDSGIGMDQTEQKNVFLSYEQGHSSINRKYGGTGLGLTIAQQITHLMDGTIELISSPGKGSTFLIKIPFEIATKNNKIYTNRNDAYTNKIAPTAKELQRILLVDDNTINQKLTFELLKTKNYHVTIASSGTEALQFCSEKEFDLILMDIQMPGMNGIETAFTLRSRNNTTPIIALTAQNASELNSEYPQNPIDDLVQKPIIPELLYSVVYNWINHPQHNNQITADSAILQNNISNERIYRIVLKQFLEDFAGLEKKLHQHIKSKNMESVKGYLHSIKGVASSIGAEKLSLLTRSIEKEIKEKNTLPDATTVISYEKLYKQAVTEIILYLEQKPVYEEKNDIQSAESSKNVLFKELINYVQNGDSRMHSSLKQLLSLEKNVSIVEQLVLLKNIIEECEYDKALDLIHELSGYGEI